MVPAVAVLLEESSPSRQRKRQRHRLASNGPGTGDFELRHWRPGKRAGSGMRGRWVPPEIEIPDGEAGGYTSLRDIMSSPEYAAAAAAKAAGSPAAGGAGGAGGSCSDVHMIRHPLVKHAAYTYLQLTPSAREDDHGSWGRRRRRGPLCRLLVSCLGFIGAFFGR